MIQKSNQGLTLIELLVGIFLTSMIFLAASSLVVVLFSSNTRTKQMDEIQQAKNDLLNEISNAVKWAAFIELIGTGKFQATLFDGTTHVYMYDAINNTLNKNGVPLHTSGVNVTVFEVSSLGVNADADAPKSLQIKIELEDGQLKQIKDAFRIVASQRSVDTSI